VPYAAGPVYAGPPQSSGGGAGTVLAVIGVVILGAIVVCGGFAALLVVPAIGSARVAAQRTMSANNLKQLGLAIHMYHDTYRELPPAIVKDKDGKPLYSGLVLLLPFIEQDIVYQQFDKSKAWDDPANVHLSRQAMQVFVNPASK